MNSQYFDIVLRPAHTGEGWFAWLGLGSFMVSVIDKDNNYNARFATRETARAAALSAMGKLKALWLAKNTGKRMTGQRGEGGFSNKVYIHEGPADTHTDHKSSWDLPIVEELESIPISADGFTTNDELSREERKAARNRRKTENHRRNHPITSKED